MKFFKKSPTARTLHYFFKIIKKRKFALSINLTTPVIGVFLGETLLGYNVGKLVQGIVEFSPGDSTDELYHLARIIIFLFIAQIIFSYLSL